MTQRKKNWLRPLISVCLLCLLLAGCAAPDGDSSAPSAQTEAEQSTAGDAQAADNTQASVPTTAVSETGSEQSTASESAYSSNHDTAPMPETELTVDMLLGTWSPDADEDSSQHTYIEFFYDENNQLSYYYYYLIVDPFIHGSSEPFVFEINHGLVTLYLNQGSCLCHVFDRENICDSFYLHDMSDGVICHQENGRLFYKISDSITDNRIHTIP